MNREIKFRAWDNENKYIVISKQGVFTALRNSMNIVRQADGYYNDGDLLKPNKEKYILMQYTGLHDKNGKEIYEGDIVKVYFKKGAWKYNNKNYYGYKNGKVQYCVDCFILYIENYKEKIYPLSSFCNNNNNINELEVIGNVWEDSDLLNDSENTKSN